MDDLTLREKLDAIEACERLMARYQAKVEADNRVAIHEEDEETVDYDFSSMDRDQLNYYKKLRNSLLDSLENDDILRRAAESNSLSR
jgi:hypothetical protein